MKITHYIDVLLRRISMYALIGQGAQILVFELEVCHKCVILFTCISKVKKKFQNTTKQRSGTFPELETDQRAHTAHNKHRVCLYTAASAS
jgi:hypothetical protein